LLYADGNVDPTRLGLLERLAGAAVAAARGHMEVCLIAAPDADVAASNLPLIRDGEGDFARAYDAGPASVFVVRPDGYLGYASSVVGDDGVRNTLHHLGTVFA
jgi:pentachlorophenol monooxygenase